MKKRSKRNAMHQYNTMQIPLFFKYTIVAFLSLPNFVVSFHSSTFRSQGYTDSMLHKPRVSSQKWYEQGIPIVLMKVSRRVEAQNSVPYHTKAFKTNFSCPFTPDLVYTVITCSCTIFSIYDNSICYAEIFMLIHALSSSYLAMSRRKE